MPSCRDPEAQLDRLDRSTEPLYSVKESPAALKTLQQALANAQQTQNQAKQIDILTGLGCLYCSLEDYAVAMKYLKQALQIAQGLKKTRKVILVFYYLGEVYLKSEHYQQALICYEKALIILEYSLDYTKFNNSRFNEKPADDVELKYFVFKKYFNKRANLAMILERMGLVELCLERPLNARSACDRALKTYQKLGDRLGEARILDYLGAAHYKLGNPSRSIWYHLQALGIFRNLNSADNSSEMAHINQVYQYLGLHCEGLKLYRRVLMILKNIERTKRQQAV